MLKIFTHSIFAVHQPCLQRKKPKDIMMYIRGMDAKTMYLIIFSPHKNFRVNFTTPET